MEAFLSEIISNSNTPLLTALVLGLMTAISPCSMATNITAIGFIGRETEDKRRVFISGLIYTLGRAVAYTSLAGVIIIGADQFEISGWFQNYGEKIIGPVLVLIGLLMLDVININMPGLGKLQERLQEKGGGSYWQVFLLGIVFALAFCPYSGVLYFGMLIPMSIASPSGILLPVVFAIATGIPVIIFAWLIAFTVSSIGKVYNKIKTFEKWFKRIIAVLFIAVGLYYIGMLIF
jgi:sulfite exporter TauE/SafE